MTELDTPAEIREALAMPATGASVAAIKKAVVRSLRTVDPRVSVETTDYFNHSFAPDLVLTWPFTPSQPERFVYLRFNEHLDWISQDLRLIEDRHPVVYGLAASLPDSPAEAAELSRQSAETQTLVTDAASVDFLAAEPPTGLGGLVGRAIIRGGRGLLDTQRASSVTTEIADGFQAARSADTARTRSAVERAIEFLRPSESDRLLGFLQAMWIGAGARSDDFPGPVAISQDPGNDGLAFLIQDEEIADRQFWRALGSSLSLERLASLGLVGAPPNLQHVISANIDRLWARACRVKPDEPRLGDDSSLLWRVDRGLVALSGSSFTAYLGSTVDDIDQIKVGRKHNGVTVAELRQRSSSPVDLLELSNGERVVTYGSEDQTDVASDDALGALSDALGFSNVRRATVNLNDRRLDLDFTTNTISARTSGRPPVSDLLKVGLPLLWDLNETERHELTVLTAPDGDQQALELFPDEDRQTPSSLF